MSLLYPYKLVPLFFKLTVVQTDDVGIFESSLSNEYFLAAQHFDLTYSELVVLSYSAVNAIFGGEQEKRRLRRLLITFGNTIPG